MPRPATTNNRPRHMSRKPMRRLRLDLAISRACHEGRPEERIEVVAPELLGLANKVASPAGQFLTDFLITARGHGVGQRFRVHSLKCDQLSEGGSTEKALPPDPGSPPPSRPDGPRAANGRHSAPGIRSCRQRSRR